MIKSLSTERSTKSKRVIMRAEVAAGVPERLQEIVEQNGMKHVTVLSNVISFLAEQSPEIQRMILVPSPDADPSSAAIRILKSMAVSSSPER